MKQYIIFLLGLLIFSACTDEQNASQQIQVEEGIPVDVKLSVDVPVSDKVETKSFTDNDVSGLYLFSYKEGEDGDYVASQYYSENNLSSPVSFSTFSGRQQIYAIGNAGYDMFPEVSKTLDEWLLSPPKKSEFLSLMATVGGENAIQFANTTMLVNGVWTDEDSQAEVCTIGTTGSTTNGTILLKRASSKVNFNIKVNSGRTFQLESYQVCDVPQEVNLWGDLRTTKYYSTPELTISDNISSISFYMPENIVTGTNCKSEDDRELLSKGTLRNSTPDEREFKNVGKPATYILLKGSYRSVSENQTTEAKVVYCIHLGLGAGQNAQDHNDFSTYRNKDYTYTITVAGVNNIITEVTTDRDFPREEGDVIVSASAKVLTLDAHFETRLMTFKKSDLLESGTNFTFYVKDPNTHFQYKENNELNEINEEAKDWVYFKYVKTNTPNKYEYPGDKQKGKDLLSVSDLVDNLRLWTKNETSSVFDRNAESVDLVCFVNEYYYQNIQWNEFVNTEDREMLIICKTDKQQNGGNSSYTTNASYVIRQRPIQTVYSLSGDYNAWGIETINETDLLNVSDKPKGAEDIAYGRSNLPFTLNGTELWSNFLNYSQESSENMMKGSFSNAYYACLQRNRDENGNEKIDKEEAKWYLASSGQYISLWLGRSSLSTESSLFNIGSWVEEGFNKSIPAKYHYVPSNKGQKNVFWAEEGITIGGDGTHTKGDIRNYRCVRDLNKQGDDKSNLKTTVKPETVFNISSHTNDMVTVKFDYLNSNSLKPAASTGELDGHTERDNAINRPYKSFNIRRSLLTGAGTWTNKTSLKNPCSSFGIGWRMPNQTELSVIYLIAEDASAYNEEYSVEFFKGLRSETIFARSAYSGIAQNGTKNKHAYRLVKGGNVSLVERNGDKGYIRCVKDN